MTPEIPDVRRDFVGYGGEPPKPVIWPENARVAVSVVVNFEEGAERTPLYGDDVVVTGEGHVVRENRRDLQGESVLEYGTRVGVWRLLDLFQKYDIKATFATCGMSVEAIPSVARVIAEQGHELLAHGYRYAPMYTFSREAEREQIRKAVDAFERITGQRPLGWYSSGWSANTRELVVDEGGFVYDSDSYAEDIPYFVMVGDRKWLVVPYNLDTNDSKYRVMTGYSQPNDFFVTLKGAFDCLYDEGASYPKMMSVGLHMRLSGRPARINALEDFIRHVRGFPRVWFPRRIDIASWWLEHYGDLGPLGS